MNKERFLELCNYDFESEIIERHKGEEKRYFHINRKSVPLLSPSRLSKPFKEHLFWNIPKSKIFEPRTLGKLIHLGVERCFLKGDYVNLDLDLIEYFLPIEFEVLSKWKEEELLPFLEKINWAQRKIIDYLNENNIKILNVEKHINNKHYHGFVDALGLYNDEPVIIDFKTSKQPYKYKKEHEFQLAVYRNIMENTAKTFILHFNVSNGEINFIEYIKGDFVMERVENYRELF